MKENIWILSSLWKRTPLKKEKLSQLDRLAAALNKRCYWTHITSVYGMLSLFYNAAHAHPSASSLLHRGAAHTCTARSLSKYCLRSPSHQDSYFHCSWIDHIWEKMLSAPFSAGSEQNLLQNMPICFSNYILKVLLRNRDIASDLQMTNHFPIFIVYTI